MFEDRQQAGRRLAEKLIKFKGDKQTIILAIPRGGVVVGAQMAEILSVSMEAISVKKLGSPDNRELAIGAIASGGVKFIDWDLALRLGVEQDYLDREIADKSVEAVKRERQLGIKNLDKKIANAKVILLADDGVATGSTVMVTAKYIDDIEKKYSIKDKTKSKKIKILTVPVIAKDVYDRIRKEFDKIVALEVSMTFGAVGQFYREFSQVEDAQAVRLLKKYRV